MSCIDYCLFACHGRYDFDPLEDDEPLFAAPPSTAPGVSVDEAKKAPGT